MLTIKEIHKQISVKKGFNKRDDYLSYAVLNYDKQQLLEEAYLLVEKNKKSKRASFEISNALTCAGVLLWFADKTDEAKEVLSTALAFDGRKGHLPELINMAIVRGLPPKEVICCFEREPERQEA
jgi:hypothetical protein